MATPIPPLHKRIIAHPFRYYGKMMGITFCLVSATNISTSVLYPKRLDALTVHPDAFAFCVLLKSTYYGLLWPAFYVTAITSPKNAFVLWSGIEELSINNQKIDLK